MTTIAVGVLILAHSFEAKPPPPPPDPDVVIARYQKECAGGSKSSSCQDLHFEVETAFLADLVELRAAGAKVEPELYRAAASAETPQLVCLGLRELAGPKMSPEEQALFADALESPYRGTRKMVIQLARYRDPIKELMARVPPEALRDGDLQEGYLDELRDPEPDPKLAGGYPGARYRYFASSPVRGWFTTPDSPEKVIAFLTKGGKKALTGAEMKKTAAQPQIDQAAMIKAAQSGDKAKIQELIRAASTPRTDWTRGIEGMRGAGEILYVTLSPTQVVAVFKDDVLRATSIVAPAPPLPAAPLDPTNMKRDALARRVFSH